MMIADIDPCVGACVVGSNQPDPTVDRRLLLLMGNAKGRSTSHGRAEPDPIDGCMTGADPADEEVQRARPTWSVVRPV